MNGDRDDDKTPSLGALDPNAAKPPPLERGASVDRYLVVERLGEGGMGVVYKAYDPELDRSVALKLLNTEGDARAGLRARLLREAQALARVQHPNVIAVHDVGTFGADVFIAMEFVEGPTLRQWTKAQKRSVDEIVQVYLAAGEGLAAANRAGLVHRDFKPDNVIVGKDGRVRVLDFGLARTAGDGPASATTTTPAATTQPVADGATTDAPASPTTSAPTQPPAVVASRAPIVDAATEDVTAAAPPRPLSSLPASLSASFSASTTPSRASVAVDSSSANSSRRSSRLLDSPLTNAGSILGTPRFMAPEQHLSEAVDARADQFSYCVSLYEALYGEFPFAGANAAEYKANVLAGRLREPPAGTRVSRRLRQLLLRGLALEPANRFASLDELLPELAGPRARTPTRLVSMALTTMVALALVASLGLVWRARVSERAQLCQGGKQRLSAVWSDGTRARLRAAFVATGKPFALDAWNNVEATLDRYAARFVDAHRDSCEATRLRGEQTDAVMTLRMTCLDRKLQGLTALVDVLGQTDAKTIEKAPSAAAGLASLDTCSDVPALLAEVPPPDDPRLRDQLSDIRAQVARADALRLAGRLDNAAEVAQAAVKMARTTGERVILAETLTEEGRGRLSVDPARAIELLTEAFWDAYSTRLDRLAVASAIWLSTAYTLSSRYDQAVFWQEHAQAGLDRIGGDKELEAELWAERGRRADEMGLYDESLAAYSRAERLTEKRLGSDDVQTLRRQNDELTALTNAARVLEASQKLRPLYEHQVRLLGANHPAVARSLMDLGDDEVAIGRLADAREHFARAEKVYRAAGNTDSLSFIALLRYRVSLNLAEGKFAEAAALSKEALALLEAASMPRTELAFELRSTLGQALVGLGHTKEAQAAMVQALAGAERVHGSDNATVTPLLAALADCLLEQNKPREAEVYAARALAIARKQNGEAHFETASARIDFARVLVAEGRAAEALAAVESSEPPVVRALGEWSPLVGNARRIRGNALAALGRVDEARAALTSALAIADRAGTSRSERDAIAAALARLADRHASAR